MAQNSIDRFRFISLSRPPALEMAPVITRTRPGVDGVARQRLGRWGQPFAVVSVVDAPTLADAWALYQQYVQLQRTADTVSVTWADYPLALDDVRFGVDFVQPLELRAVVRGHGGLNGTSYARIACQWGLQPVGTL